MDDYSTRNDQTRGDTGTDGRRSWTEEFDVAGERLVSEVKRLVAEGNVRRLRVVEPDGDVAVDIPLNVGVIAGGVVVLAAPVLAILGALAAFVTKLRIEVVRVEDEPGDKDGTPPAGGASV